MTDTTTPAGVRGGGAFFDVDETTVSVKSMFSFLRFHLAARGEPDGAYDRLVGPLTRAAAGGAPREEVNRAYYRLFAGQAHHVLAQSGRAWFDQAAAQEGFFHDAVVGELHGLRRLVPVYLVSGSFFACLDPIAEHLGVTAALGTRPLLRRGELTGEVVVPLIGPAKAHALSAVAAAVGLDPALCSAYGDHASDLAMLEIVGHAVVVGDDPQMRAEAARRRWRTLETASVERKVSA